jgi:hypothetical protein
VLLDEENRSIFWGQSVCDVGEDSCQLFVDGDALCFDDDDDDSLYSNDIELYPHNYYFNQFLLDLERMGS